MPPEDRNLEENEIVGQEMAFSGKKEKSVIHMHTHAEPYEIMTDTTCKYSAKGEPQPEATVRITRRLQDDYMIVDLIHADLKRGVEEVMIAVKDMFKKHQERT